MPDLPGGTVTFLFTDIEGSTRMWERNPAQMPAALARHDALLRDVIEQNDGTVFKTVGDAFCAAFRTASDALAAAGAAQRALTREPWPEPVRIRVRMALHTGAAEVRDNDYFGQPLNRVARLLSAGHGGQILLSLAAQELVRDSLPAGVTLRDMGERRLKDLIRPERVYEFVAPDLPADFPPLNTLDARAHNLPIQLTSFVGREREMQEVKTLLASARLVTLTGAGGAGKTRLALQVGAERIDDYADGAWLVELAPLADPRLVPQAVATVLGLKEEPGVPLTATLARELKKKELLLLLDNCEHLVEASALLCQTLLAACARIRILATSREALRVPGETAFRVPSLATPDPKATPSLAALTQYAAVQLFIDRALAVQPAFRVDHRNAPALASICHHLDGIPLAIELAAARVRAMSVEEVNQRLDQRFRLLTGGSRMALPRQQTLRAAIDWSYDLLGASEQALFCRLCVFAGGWTLDAVEKVCAGDPVDGTDALDLLTSLVDKSLAVAEEHGGATRYRLLETMRQHARDRLRGRGEEAPWSERHLAYYAALAEEANPQLTGAEQQTWLDRLEAEHDNLAAALAWSAAASGNAERGLELAGALWWFWYVRGYLAEGREWLSTLLAAAPGGQRATRARALNGAGTLARQQGDFAAARALYEEGLAVVRELGDRQRIAVLLGNLGAVFYQQGDFPSARALYEESLAIRRELGDRGGIASALNNLGLLAKDQGDYATARAMHDESLAIRRELRDKRGVAMSLHNVGTVDFARRDYSSARALNLESLAIYRELGDREGIALALSTLGLVAAEQGDYPAARSLLEEALAISRLLGDRRAAAFSVNNLGFLAKGQGDFPAARRLLKESLALFWEMGNRVGVAGSLERLATLAGPSEAPRLWGGAERLREDVEVPLPPRDRADYEREVAAARAAMGDAGAFDQAWQEGRAMSLERVIEYALERPES